MPLRSIKPLARGVYFPAPYLSVTGQMVAFSVAAPTAAEAFGRMVEWMPIPAGADAQPILNEMWEALDRVDPQGLRPNLRVG